MLHLSSPDYNKTYSYSYIPTRYYTNQTGGRRKYLFNILATGGVLYTGQLARQPGRLKPQSLLLLLRAYRVVE